MRYNSRHDGTFFLRRFGYYRAFENCQGFRRGTQGDITRIFHFFRRALHITTRNLDGRGTLVAGHFLRTQRRFPSKLLTNDSGTQIDYRPNGQRCTYRAFSFYSIDNIRVRFRSISFCDSDSYYDELTVTSTRTTLADTLQGSSYVVQQTEHRGVHVY